MRPARRRWPTPANWKTSGDGLRSSRSGPGANNGTLADPDLRFDLLRSVQTVQDTGQPMVVGDRGAGRNHWHRAVAADHELQSSVYEECPHLFFRHARAADRAGPGDRGPG